MKHPCRSAFWYLETKGCPIRFSLNTEQKLMAGSGDNRRGGGMAVVIVIAIVALIFAGYNLWYSGGNDGDRPPVTEQR
jgi:hypothetical protein